AGGPVGGRLVHPAPRPPDRVRFPPRRLVRGPVEGGFTMIRRRRFLHADAPASAELLDSVRLLGRPLRSPEDLDPLLERIGDARYVLLGEASHGTHVYYTWRAALSRRLVEEKGFSFLAVEGDWPDCYRVNRYVKGRRDGGESARDVLHAFE